MANTAFKKGVITTPVSVANGGTASTSAADARTALGAAPLDSPSFTTLVTLPTVQLGKKSMKLADTPMSTTGDWSGITEIGTAGATLTFGQVCYFQAADSRWELANANAAATSGPLKLGICVLAAASDGSATEMLLFGKIRWASFPTLTIGAPVYLSAASAGAVVTAQPSATDQVIRIIGYGNTAAELFFTPDNSYIVHI